MGASAARARATPGPVSRRRAAPARGQPGEHRARRRARPARRSAELHAAVVGEGRGGGVDRVGRVDRCAVGRARAGVGGALEEKRAPLVGCRGAGSLLTEVGREASGHVGRVAPARLLPGSVLRAEERHRVEHEAAADHAVPRAEQVSLLVRIGGEEE